MPAPKKKDLKKYLAVKPPTKLSRKSLSKALACTSSALRKDWCKALRSGKYEKGRGILCYLSSNKEEPAKYCCLGVLAEVLIEKGFPITKHVSEMIPHHQCYVYKKINDETSILPDSLANDIGILNQQTLTVMNDSNKFSFKQIADKIEDAK